MKIKLARSAPWYPPELNQLKCELICLERLMRKTGLDSSQGHALKPPAETLIRLSSEPLTIVYDPQTLPLPLNPTSSQNIYSAITSFHGSV